VFYSWKRGKFLNSFTKNLPKASEMEKPVKAQAVSGNPLSVGDQGLTSF
jgi:hypothetical protein